MMRYSDHFNDSRDVRKRNVDDVNARIEWICKLCPNRLRIVDRTEYEECKECIVYDYCSGLDKRLWTSFQQEGEKVTVPRSKGLVGRLSSLLGRQETPIATSPSEIGMPLDMQVTMPKTSEIYQKEIKEFVENGKKELKNGKPKKKRSWEYEFENMLYLSQKEVRKEVGERVCLPGQHDWDENGKCTLCGLLSRYYRKKSEVENIV